MVIAASRAFQRRRRRALFADAAFQFRTSSPRASYSARCHSRYSVFLASTRFRRSPKKQQAARRAVGRATYLSLIVTASIFVVLTYTASLFVLDRTSFPPGDATDAAFYNIATAIGGHWLKCAAGGARCALRRAAGRARGTGCDCASALQHGARRQTADGARACQRKRKVPERAVLLVSAVTLVLGIALAEHLELLTSMVNFGALTGFLLLHVSVIVYFVRKRLDCRQPLSMGIAAVGFPSLATSLST